MAGIPVNNNLNALMNTVSQTVSASGTQNSALTKQAETVKDTFDMVMNRIGSQVSNQTGVQSMVSSQNISADTKTGSSRQDATKETTADTKEPVKAKEDTAKQTQEKETAEKVDDGSKEAVEEAGKKLVEEVAEEMDMTPEEVEEVMEILGLSAVDLLNPDNMKQLLITLSGNEDFLSIVTDAELYGHLQNLLGAVEESVETLQTELGLSEEELDALLTEIAADKQTEKMDAAELLPEQNNVTGNQTQEPSENVSLEGMKDYSVTVQKDGETVQVKVTVDDASGEQSMKENVTAVAKDTMQQGSKSDEKNTSGQNKGEGSAAGNMNVQMPVQQAEVNEVPQEQPFTERFTSTQDIMNQIMDYMKINLKDDVQELELQLHPASLGNVNVQIASKDGAVTAQFTAQNEIVKAAIESQLVQLKEQFEEQGIKVDAVEVTVADYRFEQNFSGNEQENEESQKNGKKGSRKINLNELNPDELPEDMDDADRIAADMMARSGNTVDYTA
ncbi:MAG: flagellar hook-length control protein FliK [Lachnospiraceae bacterium]|nr:flagellar hook-length control protein FliK [Lachnospiraceae bacterium]